MNVNNMILAMKIAVYLNVAMYIPFMLSLLLVKIARKYSNHAVITM